MSPHIEYSTSTDMLKLAIRKLIGESAWYFLGKARREYRYGKNSFHGDPAIFAAIKDYIPATGIYCDIGAHDGRSMSNTYYLESIGWKGVLVEPVPWKYFDILRLRSAVNYAVNAASVSFEKHGLPILIQYGDSMSIAPEISTIDEKEWSEGAKQFMHSDETEVRFWIKGLSLTSILDKSGMGTNIDFLSIDVEGSELGVLEGIDFNKYRFQVIAVETYNVTRIQNYLESKMYRVINNVSNNLIAIPSP